MSLKPRDVYNNQVKINRGVVDTEETVSAVLITLLKFNNISPTAYLKRKYVRLFASYFYVS
jgi:hypothetical protein